MTIASFIGATHSLRSISGVSGEDKIIAALIEHSKHSLQTVNFSHDLYMPVPACSLQNFQQLTNVTLPARHLVTKFTRKEWVDLPSFLPP